MDFKDYYSTLGVAKTANAKEIKQAYRKLARKHHPDVNPGDKAAESKFKEINEAYEVLGDSDKRKKYDELGANWRAYEQAGAAGGQGFDPSQFGGWNVQYGGGGPGGQGAPGGGFRTMTEDEMREMFGDADWNEGRSVDQSKRMTSWCQSIRGSRIVVIECGAGTAVRASV